MEFTELARIYEEEYMEDMHLLGVRPPTILTRVSEYVPEVISFIEGIMKNGFAYESKKSVYFDTERFSKVGLASIAWCGVTCLVWCVFFCLLFGLFRRLSCSFSRASMRERESVCVFLAVK
jgi:tRNA synthetases class I (C) catalytic domain